MYTSDLHKSYFSILGFARSRSCSLSIYYKLFFYCNWPIFGPAWKPYAPS